MICVGLRHFQQGRNIFAIAFPIKRSIEAVEKRYNCQVRHFSTTKGALKYSGNVTRRWGTTTNRFLQKASDKLSGNQTRKKKVWHKDNNGIIGGSFSGPISRGPTPGGERRARQLSVVFYEHITGLLNSGEICPQLLQLGFHIEKVTMSPDFNSIVVYWLASGTQSDREVEKHLGDCSRKLRSALIALKVIGQLPPIQFRQDLSVAKLQQVEELLKSADMGPGYEPTALGENLKSEISLSGSIGCLQQQMDNTANNMTKHRNSYTALPNEQRTLSSTTSIINDIGKYDVMAETFTSDFRGDVYNIKRDSLMLQIIVSKGRYDKRKNIDRTINGEELSRSESHRDWGDAKSTDISKLFKKQKKYNAGKMYSPLIPNSEDTDFHKQKFEDNYDDDGDDSDYENW